ncbi:Acyl-CoA dehydrogenase [Salinivirga cyanobacteriivorans]|uniref:Acyl-CoA dehydrogenase n=1 Tax=Salinivirga cyanobacteriivorans TaxID=1307839 RepID=A0A0S2HWT4_9BACT|nr:acyl-CoA dehydrogenase family protein [Salinivirga cyanobacteriivorans]ALO14522.1 Acyl-CoA dehydrogenase [Salinivirga cyanobacteriivorans]
MMITPFTTQQHENLRHKVRKFAEQEIKPIAAKLDQQAEFPEDLVRKMGKAGFFGQFLPKAYGGQGLDYLSLVLTVEEIARIDGSQAATVASHNSLGIGPIYYFGTEEQKQKWLPNLVAGDHVWAFALTEKNAGSDSRGTETKAELKNGEWIINGSKIFITNSSSPMMLGATVQAITAEKDGKKELSTIIVDAARDGFHREKITGKMMWRSADTGKMMFDNVTVPEENLLGERGKGSHMMLETLDSGRLTIGAMGLGLAQGAYELAMNYANKREQFGRPIAKFQAISFKLAEMATKIELARNTLYNAVWLKDHGKPFGKEAAMAKLYCSEIAKEVADEALQIHGAYGLVQDQDIERFYRDQRILQIGEGTSEILKLVIGRHIGL